MNIHKAKTEDHQLLSDITFQSKAYWKYSTEQMEIWREDLTITPAYLAQNEVFLLEVEKEIIGYYSFFTLTKTEVKLDNMFLLPNFIGQGYGTYLMNDFLDRIRSIGFQKVFLDSEPHAKSFYLKMGFEVVGEKESSIAGRTLPIMAKSIMD